MNHPANVFQESSEIVQCPYCNENTAIHMPGDYAPTYVYCEDCNEKFIVERLAVGFEVLTLEAASGSFSDPDTRALEMGGCDEQ